MSMTNQLGDDVLALSSHLGLGTLQRELGDYEAAADHFAAAVECGRRLNYRDGQAAARLSLASVRTAQGEYQSAVAECDAALQLWMSVSDSEGQAKALRLRGDIYATQRDFRTAAAVWEDARELFGSISDPRSQADMLARLSVAYEELGDELRALSDLQLAKQIYRAAFEREGEARVSQRIAGKLRNAGDYSGAMLEYTEAIDAYEQIRLDQQRPETRHAISNKSVLLYQEIVDFRLEQGARVEAWHWAQRAKARSLLDLLGAARPRLDTGEATALYASWRESLIRLARLEQVVRISEANYATATVRLRGDFGGTMDDASASELLQARKHERQLRDELLRQVDRGRELIKYVVPDPATVLNNLRQLVGLRATKHADDHPTVRPLLVESFWLDSGRMVIFLIPLWLEQGSEFPRVFSRISETDATWLRVRANTIQQDARDGSVDRGGLERSEAQRRHAEHASQMFSDLPRQTWDVFFASAADLLNELQPTDLVIVPHAVMNAFPLHAAMMPSGELLLERCNISYLPNAALASILLSQSSALHCGSMSVVLGPPDQRLPGGSAEAHIIAKQLEVAQFGQPYSVDRMRVDVLRTRAFSMPVVHLVTHSRFEDQDYLASFIEFHGADRLTLMDLISDGSLDFRGTQLVYLSSCEAGLSPGDRTDELPGLVWSFFAAGAESVLAGLWAVDGVAATIMAMRCYGYLQAGEPIRVAYRSAVLDVRREFPNPFFWAPFVLTGNGFRKIDVVDQSQA
jgi:CHAT domain-containing protein